MKAFISLGSNLGDRARTLERAREFLSEEEGLELVRCSPVYETDPVGPGEQARYLNAVAEIETALDPEDLLDRLHRIEDRLGRVRATRWGARTLDLDLLLYGELILDSGSLTVPHPRLCERRFVLQPLADLAPDLKVPGAGRTVRELLEAVAA
jgi:2-amino-4-hydroxy-6-hydroxymethyldihydropteridine diphosphokinase